MTVSIPAPLRRACLAALAIAPALAQALPARAAPAGFALVIGDDVYDGAPRHTACGQTAHDVANRLRQAGMVTEALTNPTGIGLRDALDNFAAQLNGAPSGSTVIYLCSTALADHERLFVLPADVSLTQPVQPETQGVVLQALLNTLAGTGGTLFADLEMLHGGRLESGAALLQDRLPPGLHLALAAGRDSHVGVLGQAISGGRIGLGDGASWDTALTGIGELGLPAGTLLTLPPSGPPAPAAPGPAPMARSAPAMPGAEVNARENSAATTLPLAARTLQTHQAGPAGGTPALAFPPPAGISPRPQAVASGASSGRSGAGDVGTVVATPLPGSPSPPAEAGPPAKPPAPDASQGEPLASRLNQHPPASSRSDRIARLQAAMLAQGVYAGPVDGAMTERTRAAIRAWQGKLGDRRTGALTQMEIVRLLNAEGGSP